MKLFLPSARATNVLLIVGFCSLGYALYIRYMAIEQSSVGLACAGGLDTWLCSSRAVIAILFKHSVFGCAALAVAVVNLLRPSPVLFGVALALTCLGIVLYNVALASLAAGLLILSFARRAPAPE
jgi:hypothetical protein